MDGFTKFCLFFAVAVMLQASKTSAQLTIFPGGGITSPCYPLGTTATSITTALGNLQSVTLNPGLISSGYPYGFPAEYPLGTLGYPLGYPLGFPSPLGLNSFNPFYYPNYPCSSILPYPYYPNSYCNCNGQFPFYPGFPYGCNGYNYNYNPSVSSNTANINTSRNNNVLISN